jgi:long-chain fatty acid transport protein
LPGTGHAGLYTSPSNPTDNTGPESAYVNPAGMTGLKTTELSVGAAVAVPVVKYETEIAEAGGDDGGDAGVGSVLPSFFLVVPFGEKFRFGFSVISPVGGPDGLGYDFGDSWAGRYGSQGVTFATTGLSVSGAWHVKDKWSIGAGVTANWLEVNLSAAVNTPVPGDGKADFQDLDDWSARYFVGVQYAVSPASSFGFVYRSEWDSNVSGNLVLSGPGINARTESTTLNLVLPQQLEFGFQQALSKTVVMDLTYSWTDWSAFSGMGVNVAFNNGDVATGIFDLNWFDSYSGGISFAYIRGGGKNIYDFGLNYSSSPVTDADRIALLPVDESLTLSFGFEHNSKHTTWSVGGALAFSGDAAIDRTDQGVRYKGEADTNVAVALAGSFAWRFK